MSENPSQNMGAASGVDATENSRLNTNPTTGYNDQAGTHGPHTSNVANAADPRVDSDRDGRGLREPQGASQQSTTANAPVEPQDGKKHGLIDGAKGLMAQGHGIGETARGYFNTAVDVAFKDEEAKKRDAAVAAGGEREFTNKKFEKGGWDKSL